MFVRATTATTKPTANKVDEGKVIGETSYRRHIWSTDIAPIGHLFKKIVTCVNGNIKFCTHTSWQLCRRVTTHAFTVQTTFGLWLELFSLLFCHSPPTADWVVEVKGWFGNYKK